MKLKQYPLLLTMLAMLAACGEAAKEQATKEQAAMPGQAPAEAMAPTTDSPSGMPAETGGDMAAGISATGVDAPALYARTCASCHGETGEGMADFPSLATLSRDVVHARLTAYRAGETVGPKSAIMAPIAKNLSDEQIAALSIYLGS